MTKDRSKGLVVLSTVTDPSLAQIMKIALNNEGIDCEIDGGFQAGLAGVLAMRLLVRADQEQIAREFLNDQANRSMLERAQPAAIEIERICVPTDFSADADYALSYGLSIAKPVGAAVHLLHVVKSSEDVAAFRAHADFTSDSVFVTDFLEKLESSGGEDADAERASPWGNTEIVRALRVGSAAEQICEYADAEQIDLIVIATRGRTGLEHVLLGSVAEQVIRKSPCPVLTVQLRQQGFLNPLDPEE